MKMRRNTFWRPRARGFTLVEAMVGGLLMASLLVAILMAMGKMSVQSRRAEDRIAACAMLDTLLEQWWRDQRQLPRNKSGQVPGHAGWSWQTRTINNPDVQPLHAEVLAVELFSPQPVDSQPAARVELLLPPPEETPDAGAGG